MPKLSSNLVLIILWVLSAGSIFTLIRKSRCALSVWNSRIFRNPSSHTFTTSIKHITRSIVVGLLLILLISLTSFTLLQMGDQFDFDDLFSFDDVIENWPLISLASTSSVALFHYGIFGLILVFQLLRSHIGEKRFSDSIFGFNHRLHFSAAAPDWAVFFAPAPQIV